MDTEAQNIAIAAALGREWHKPTEDEMASGSYYSYWPDFTSDLNSMRYAETALDCLPFHNGWQAYEYALLKLVGHDSFTIWAVKAMLTATAAQRAEAFLRTLGKWQD